jgi:hypothetical protein
MTARRVVGPSQILLSMRRLRHWKMRDSWQASIVLEIFLPNFKTKKNYYLRPFLD